MRLVLENIEFSSERKYQGYSVGGILYVMLQDTYFPSENWYDMAYFDLKEWIPSLVSFGMKHTDSCILPFMDGPYAINIARVDDNSIVASCKYDHNPVISCVEIDFLQFIQSVISCCRMYDRFLFEYGKENLFTQDIKQLKSTMDI